MARNTTPAGTGTANTGGTTAGTIAGAGPAPGTAPRTGSNPTAGSATAMGEASRSAGTTTGDVNAAGAGTGTAGTGAESAGAAAGDTIQPTAPTAYVADASAPTPPSSAPEGEGDTTHVVETPDGDQVEVRTRTRAPGAQKIKVRDVDASTALTEADMEVQAAPEGTNEAETFIAMPSGNSSATERFADLIDRGDLEMAAAPADTLIKRALSERPDDEHVPLSSGTAGAYKIVDGKRVPDRGDDAEAGVQGAGQEAETAADAATDEE